MKIEYRDKITKLMLVFLTYFYISFLLIPFFTKILKFDFKNNYVSSYLIYDIVYQIIVFVVGVALYSYVLKKDIKKTKEEVEKSGVLVFFKKILTGYILCLLIGYFAGYLESILSAIFNITLTQSDNQSIIEKLMKEGPLLMIISSCLFAPIIEELIFRCGVRQVIKDKRVFITVSGLIFGLMHVTESVLLILEILIAGIILTEIIYSDKDDKVFLSVTALVSVFVIFGVIYYLIYGNLFSVIKSLDAKEIIVSISYIFMGSMLSLIYVKYDNIILNMLIHAFNNIVSTIIILSLL